MLNNLHNPDVLNCLANLSNDEVFTSPNIANQMLDTLPKELWHNKNAKFLDPFCKSGVFLREIAKRLIKGLEHKIPDLQERINHIMQHQIYGIGITELTALLARRSLYCAKNTNSQHCVTPVFNNENGNIAFESTNHSWDNSGKCQYCGVSKTTLDENKRENLEIHAYQFIHNQNPFKDMQFDVIIGNPPYQLNVGVEKKNFAIAIYQKFIEQAIKMKPHYLCMIVPSRWFAGGRGLDGFREQMLNDRRLKEIHDFPNSSEVFPGVEIKGGVNYFLWQSDYQGDCLVSTYEKDKCISEMKRPLLENDANVFIRFNQGISILRKVKSFNEKSFKTFVSVQTPFGLISSFREYEKKEFANSVKIFVTKEVGYMKKEKIQRNTHLIDEHKIFITKSYGAGESFPHQILNVPIYGEPNSCCTQTYLVIGAFASKNRCNNVMSYIKTRFFRFLVLLKKPSQDAMRGVYEFVPQQNFDEEWTDEKLYKKYGLTEDEINFIESMIRPME